MNQDASTVGDVSFAFIRDEAAGKDFFGSHDRVAMSLASVIRDNPDLRVIGLLGPWGSGKSTVVKLVQSELEKDKENKTYCFSYDAWLHQSDPPRRSFLETLIHFLVAEKLTKHEDWKDQLGLLNRQVEDTETTSTPTFTFSGKLIIASLFLLPLGMQFVSHDWYNAAFGSDKSLAALFVLLAGVVLLLLPAILAFGVYFSWRPTKSPLNRIFWTMKNWSQHNERHAHESILSLVMNKEVQRHRNRVTRSPEPTAIEFQDVFRTIMDKVSGNKRRFLFIIDNLDRLPEAEAVAMWGTIRSFFLGARETNHVRKSTQLPTVILPIDAEAVERMYSAAHGDDASEFARSFMDKTFDLTFRVTPPILSNWTAYLDEQMRAVFGERMPREWSYLTGRLYEKFLLLTSSVTNQAAVTPRTINKLINDMATLWLQWKNSGIEFVSVAYYAIFRDYNNGDIRRAVATPQAGIETLDLDWQRAFAALHYGVNPSDAVQVLIEQQLRKAITEKDLGAFREIAKVRGFEPVFQRILDDFAVNDGLDPSIWLGATALLNGLSPPAAIWVNHAWRITRTLFRRSGPWKQFGPDESSLIKTLMAHCDVSELQQFVDAVGNKLAGLDDTVITTLAFAPSFVDVWGGAANALRANKIAIPKILVPGNADTFMLVATACKADQELLRQLTTKIADADIVQQLTSDLVSGTRIPEVVTRLDVLLTIGRPLPWDALVTAAGQVVQDQNANSPPMVAALSCLGILRPGNPAAKTRIQQLADGGQLLARLNEAHPQNNDQVAARAAALLILTKPDFVVPDTGAWADRLTARPVLTQFIDDALVQYDATDNFVYLIDAASTHPGLVQIVRAVITLRVAQKRLSSVAIPAAVAQLDKYLSCIDASTQDSFIQQIAGADAFWDELAKLAFTGNAVAIFHALIKDGSGQEETARRRLKERLDAVPMESWATALESAGEPLQISIALADIVTGGLNIGTPLYDALETATAKLLSNADENYRLRWFEMAGFLSVNGRHTLFKNVRDKICGGTSISNLLDLLKKSPNGFFSDANFAQEPDGAVRHVVLPILSNPADGIEWLIGATAISRDWVKGSDATTQRFLAERLSALWTESDEAQKERLRILQAAWLLPELPLPQAESVDDGDRQSETAQ